MYVNEVAKRLVGFLPRCSVSSEGGTEDNTYRGLHTARFSLYSSHELPVHAVLGAASLSVIPQKVKDHRGWY